MNAKQREEELTLRVLEAIEAQSDVTQRHLARRMGIALGMANSYLKRCVRKGLVKIQQAPANRYLYYLTPKGFTEKSRLTAEYLSYSFDFYRKAGASCREVLAPLRHQGGQCVGFYGASELAEIAALQAMELGLELSCVCDPMSERQHFLSLMVLRDIQDAPALDGWLLTDLANPQQSRQLMVQRFGHEHVLVPEVLGLGLSDAP